jgi:hypothetical protein
MELELATALMRLSMVRAQPSGLPGRVVGVAMLVRSRDDLFDDFPVHVR